MKIYVKVIPGSKKIEVQEDLDIFGEKIFRVRVRSVPENGKANEELIKVLSDYFKVPKRDVKILKGVVSSGKIIEICSQKE